VIPVAIAAGAVANIPAHAIGERFASPLPLELYLLAGALVVALSARPTRPSADAAPIAAPPRALPRPLALLLGAAGIGGWFWIAAQAVVGGNTSARVDDTLLWVYGWVGIAYLSMLLPGAWPAIDPHRRIAALLRRALRRPAPPAVRADHLAVGAPALIGIVGIVWLELVATGAGGGLRLLAAHALVAAWAIAGRLRAEDPDAWAAANDPLTAYFGLFASLRERRTAWTTAEALLATVAASGVIFDGLAQGAPFFSLFGVPGDALRTLLLLGWLAAAAVAAALAARAAAGNAWREALGAGLLPVAAGYLVAHYASWLLVSGQRLFVAASDPLQLGWDLFGTAYLEPTGAWLPGWAVWGLQLVAVVAGHVVGMHRGHAVARAAGRRSTLPLTLLMVGLTLLTLWSLGQTIVEPPLSA